MIAPIIYTCKEIWNEKWLFMPRKMRISSLSKMAGHFSSLRFVLFIFLLFYIRKRLSFLCLSACVCVCVCVRKCMGDCVFFPSVCVDFLWAYMCFLCGDVYIWAWAHAYVWVLVYVCVCVCVLVAKFERRDRWKWFIEDITMNSESSPTPPDNFTTRSVNHFPYKVIFCY